MSACERVCERVCNTERRPHTYLRCRCRVPLPAASARACDSEAGVCATPVCARVPQWYRMLSTLELPLVALPHSNPTKLYMRPPPPTIFTWEVVEIIDRLESSVFDEFGYVRREAPFELRV